MAKAYDPVDIRDRVEFSALIVVGARPPDARTSADRPRSARPSMIAAAGPGRRSSIEGRRPPVRGAAVAASDCPEAGRLVGPLSSFSMAAPREAASSGSTGEVTAPPSGASSPLPAGPGASVVAIRIPVDGRRRPLV